MSIATSRDDGLSWQVEGFIIAGKDAPTPGKFTGEGDCTAVNGGDGYFYAYCARATDFATFAARAPVSTPGPGNWRKYFEGNWSQPGVSGDASRLNLKNWTVGTATARWLTTGETVNLGTVAGGLGLYFSSDHIHFTALPVPILHFDQGVTWAKRLQDPHELLVYFSLLDARTGENLLGDHWNLFYMDLQPHESFDKRYLVFRPVEVSSRRSPDDPQVGVALAHWYSAARHEHWSTVAAVPGNYNVFRLIGMSGYLMTAPDSARPSTELEDCVLQRDGYLDHVLMRMSEKCASHGYTRQRPAGWVFTQPEAGAQPLYLCISDADRGHFAS